jgi:Gpi18-like mannosyltransferase
MYSIKLFKFFPEFFERLRSSYYSHPWAWTDILLPFLTTRFALFLVGWYATIIPPNNSYPIETAVKRGWQFTSYHLIDIWARWDSGWYLTIIKNGYQSNSDISSMMSNIAFYPMYPYLVKLILLPFPASFLSDTKIILIGILLSNAFLLASLFILYRLVSTLFNQADIAKRTVLYLLIFPSSFFFSAFYTEATFLFFAVCAFYFANKRSWIPANVCGFFLALARPLGFLIFLPLVIQYLESLDWKLKKIGWKILLW